MAETGRLRPETEAVAKPSSSRTPEGDHIRRLNLGLSLDELARETGVEPSAIHRYEFARSGSADEDLVRKLGETLDRLEAGRNAASSKS